VKTIDTALSHRLDEVTGACAFREGSAPSPALPAAGERAGSLVKERGGSVGLRFQIGLGRLFETVFWICVFFGSFSIVVRWYNHFGYIENLDEVLIDTYLSIRMAAAIALVVVSPCMVIGKVANRSIVAAVVALVLGLIVAIVLRTA
jgi:hypothetical protein